MIEEFRQAAVSATLNIFETMFFTFLELNEPSGSTKDVLELSAEQFQSEAEDPAGQNLITEIPFSGNNSGILRLFLPYNLGESLAMNFLGFEEEVTESQILDMASELANMICGNMFSRLDKKAVYILGSPITKKITSEEALERLTSATITLNFLAEGQRATIQLQFNPRP